MSENDVTNGVMVNGEVSEAVADLVTEQIEQALGEEAATITKIGEFDASRKWHMERMFAEAFPEEEEE